MRSKISEFAEYAIKTEQERRTKEIMIIDLLDEVLMDRTLSEDTRLRISVITLIVKNEEDENTAKLTWQVAEALRAGDEAVSFD